MIQSSQRTHVRQLAALGEGMIIRMIIDATILLLSGGIVIIHLVLFVGLARVVSVQKRCSRRERPSPGETLSLVVPARDEEANLPRLLSSLDRQTDRSFELILVNDRSTDTTGKIMEEYAGRERGRVRVVTLSEEDVIPGVNPKQNALAHGVRHSSGEILLFTDSDCELEPTWVADMAGRYGDPELGLVIGPITTNVNGGFVTRFHAFDHIFKYGYTAGSVGIGIPTGGFGNNLSMRRETLDEVGGFESLGYSTTEDAALIAAVRIRTSWKIGAFISQRSLVHTSPFRSLKAVAAQEVRWHIGGLFSEDINTRLSYGYLMLFLTASMMSLPFVPLLPELSLMPLTSFATMACMAFLAGVLTRRPFHSYWWWFLPDLLLTMLFNSYLTLRAIVRPTVVWKGRKL